MSVKTKDVTEFLKYLIDTTMVFTTNDTDHVVKVGSNELVYLTSENGNRSPIILYREEINGADAKESHILNPLAEGLGQTPASLWFFKSLIGALLGRIATLGKTIITVAEKEKKKKPESKENSPHIPIELFNIASHIIDDVDEKTVAEFSQLFEGTEGGSVLSLYYQKKNFRHIVKSSIFESEENKDLQIPSWKSKFPKIRKKSWNAFEQLLLDILGIKNKDELSKFDRKADNLSCVRFSSLLNVLLAIYLEINPLLSIIDDGSCAIDLTEFTNHINKLSEYVDNARYMVTPQRVVPSANSVVVPGTTPTVPSAMSAYAPPPTNVTLVPGPEYVDGRQSPPIPVYNTGMGGVPVPGYNQWQQPQQPYGYQPPFMQPPQPPQFYSPQPPFLPPYHQIPYTPPNQGLNIIPGMPPGIYR